MEAFQPVVIYQDEYGQESAQKRDKEVKSKCQNSMKLHLTFTKIFVCVYIYAYNVDQAPCKCECSIWYFSAWL